MLFCTRFRTSLEMTMLSYSASLSNLASHLYYDMTTFIKLNKILIKSCRILINMQTKYGPIGIIIHNKGNFNHRDFL